MWYFAAAEIGDKDCGMFLKPPFQRTIYVRGNLVCQLTFHCRLVLELSLLHLSHHVCIYHIMSASITSCVEAESEWNTLLAHATYMLALNLLRDVFFSNPIET